MNNNHLNDELSALKRLWIFHWLRLHGFQVLVTSFTTWTMNKYFAGVDSIFIQVFSGTNLIYVNDNIKEVIKWLASTFNSESLQNAAKWVYLSNKR